jgi:uncharacterized protein
MRRPEQAALGAVVALGRELRERGICTSVDQELLLCRALGEVDLRDRDQVYWASRAAFVRAPHEAAPFDAVFDRFWAGLALGGPDDAVAQHGEADPRMPGPNHGGESLPQYRHGGRSSQLVDGQPTRASREVPTAGADQDGRRGPRQRRGVLAAYSPDETLSGPEPLRYAGDELAAVRRLAEELRASAPERRSRRLRPSRRSGRLDLRRTLRRALATDGEPLRLAFAAPSRAPRRLVFLCDVSGSMERYSRALLAALGAVAGSGLRAEGFVFATRLTRLTPALACRDAARALDKARAAVADWSGGTRIGETLADFNRTHARRGVARGAIVVVVSDGWDRGDPEVLARELRRLRDQCRRLVWLNPRPAGIDGQPLAIGMRAALPYVDDFVPGHDPEAVMRLAAIVGGLGEGRPARAQRPVALGAR